MKRLMANGAIVGLGVLLATGLTEAAFALGAELTFEWYVAAVAGVAWWCGWRSALVAAFASAAAIDFVFLPFHRFSFGVGLADAGRLFVFVGLALLVAHLVSARRRAESERERRERLLAMVAHELGNLIFALRTWTAVLHRDQLSGPELDHAFAALARTADAIARLTRDLLDWSRIALGRLDLKLGDVDLAEVVHDAIEEMKARAAEVGVKLSWSLARTPVHADRDRLHQVALNLLTNSLKATRPGDEVTISVCPADDRAIFSVRDTGRGIDPQLLARLFDPATLRSDSTGLGLGLALSRDLIRFQGGDVRVHSGGPGTGATFCVELPTAGGSPGGDLWRRAG